MRCARIRSIREFDDAYTAPHHGFQDAADYYQRASAMRVIDKISIPTLIITAADDPFVPPGPFKEPAVTRNRNITLKLTPHGGHCGFVEEPRADTTATGRSGRSFASWHRTVAL